MGIEQIAMLKNYIPKIGRGFGEKNGSLYSTRKEMGLKNTCGGRHAKSNV